MDNFNAENQNGVFGGVDYNEGSNTNSYGEVKQQASSTNVFASFGTPTGNATGVENAGTAFQPIDRQKAITKQGLWTRIKSFLFQEIDLTAPIKVELTPYQQKVEDEINEFLHQEVSLKNIGKLFSKK